MTATTREQELKDKALKVARHVMGQADELGKGFHTDDDMLAMLLSMSLTQMTTDYTAKDIAKSIDALIKSREMATPSVKVWTYLCLFTNWLSWAWYAHNEEELSKAWADGWYKINDYSLDTLKGDDLKYYVKTTD